MTVMTSLVMAFKAARTLNGARLGWLINRKDREVEDRYRLANSDDASIDF